MKEPEPTQVEGGGKSSAVFTVNPRGRAARAEASQGTPFGRYTLLKRLASGGMGEIFLAKQSGQGGFSKLIAIKRILAHYKEDQDHVRMFFDEAKLQAILSDRHIVQIYDMGEVDDHLFIAMEYVHGVSWRRLLERASEDGRIIHPAHACDLAVQVCRGLSYAHNVKESTGKPLAIVHRDINPQNIIVSYEGEVKIIDFGIAKSAINEVHTSTGTLKGKFAYMSPEQGKGDKLDKRSDIFSFGLCLYELLAKQNPFKRANVVASLAAIQGEPLPPLVEHRPDCAVFEPILKKCLAKDPSDRFEDCSEIAERLIELYAGGAIPEPKIPLPTWLQEMFEEEIQDHLELLGRTGLRTGGMALRGAPIASSPSLNAPYSVNAEASDPARRRKAQALHDAPTALVAESGLVADAGGPSDELLFSDDGVSAETALALPRSLSGPTAKGLGTSLDDGPLFGSATAEGSLGEGTAPELAAFSQSSHGLAGGEGAKADTDPTASNPSLLSDAGVAAPRARGRSLMMGTLSGLVAGLAAVTGLLALLSSDPPAPPASEAEVGQPAEQGAAPTGDAAPKPADGEERLELTDDDMAVAVDEDPPPSPVDDGEDAESAAREPVDVAKADANESTDRERTERERPERARADGEREEADRERAEREKADRERAEREKADRARAERETADRERAGREKADRERAEREKADRERADRERAERERAERTERTEKTARVEKPVEKAERPEKRAAIDAGKVVFRLPSGYRANGGSSVVLVEGKKRTVAVSGPEGGYALKLVFSVEGGTASVDVSSTPPSIFRVDNVGVPRGVPIELPRGRQISLVVKSPKIGDEIELNLKYVPR